GSVLPSDPPEGASEVLRERIVDVDLLPRPRMPEAEALRVEERTGEPERLRRVSSTPVGGIAEDRVTDRGEVHAERVGPPRPRRGGEERSARAETLRDLEACLRLAAGPGSHADPRPGARERRVDGE